MTTDKGKPSEESRAWAHVMWATGLHGVDQIAVALDAMREKTVRECAAVLDEQLRKITETDYDSETGGEEEVQEAQRSILALLGEKK